MRSLFFWIFFRLQRGPKLVTNDFYFPGLKQASQLEATGYCWLLMSSSTLEILFLTSPKLLPPNGWQGGTLMHSLRNMSFSFHFEYVLYCCPDSQMSSLFDWDSSSYAIMPWTFSEWKSCLPFKKKNLVKISRDFLKIWTCFLLVSWGFWGVPFDLWGENNRVILFNVGILVTFSFLKPASHNVAISLSR